MCSYLDQVGSTYYFRRAVPEDLIGYFFTDKGNPRTNWKWSLRTKDREEAKRRLPSHLIETSKLIDDARAALAAAAEAVPGDPFAAQRAAEEREAAARLAAAKQERHAARSALRVALRERLHLNTGELTPDEAAWRDLVNEARAEAAELRAATAGQAARNVVVANRMGKAVPPSAAATLTGLYERFAVSGSANANTVKRWRARVAALVAFLGHNDVTQVTRADLNRWVQSLVARQLSKKTITAGYLPAIKVTLGLAVDDELIPTNPASGLTVKAPKPVKLRERDLTDAEAKTILTAACGPQPARLADNHVLARRWVPWLCAYTGARVGEITQLRAMDIRCDDGVWFIHITPEAGGVKTGESRSVPLHSHLIEQGLTKLAKAGDATPLFYTDGTGNDANPAAKIRAAALAEWVRTLGVEAPQPNHGWRHRFKTQARAAGIEEYIAERIQGHAPRNAGGGYGFVPLGTLRDAIDRLPRYEIDGAAQPAPE